MDVASNPWVTAQERALAQELRELDRFDDDASDALELEQGWDQPEACDIAGLAPDEVVEALSGSAHPADLLLLASFSSSDLTTPLARVRRLQALDRLAALIAAMRSEDLVALAGESSSGAHLDEVHVEHEVSVARRTSRYAAGRAIETARSLTTTFQSFAAALRAGEVSESHCSVLVERTRAVGDAGVLRAIEARVLPKARRLPPGAFGKEVAKAIAALDPDAAGRVRRSRAARTVYARPIDDGLGFLGYVDDWPTVSAVLQTLTSDAEAMRSARPEEAQAADVADATQVDDVDEATMGGLRADALSARVLGAVADDGSVSWDRTNIRTTPHLVMDLDTLRGERDGLAFLDQQPVPAPVARDYVESATEWRRMVTDPIDGHLLDYGSRTYLPGKLRRYVLARDGECRAPACGDHDSRRLQMDHVEEFPDGPSSSANAGALSIPCHQLKTAGLVDITDSRADGSCTWATAWGQRVVIPPRPYLDDPPPRPPGTPAMTHPDAEPGDEGGPSTPPPPLGDPSYDDEPPF